MCYRFRIISEIRSNNEFSSRETKTTAIRMDTKMLNANEITKWAEIFTGWFYYISLDSCKVWKHLQTLYQCCAWALSNLTRSIIAAQPSAIKKRSSHKIGIGYFQNNYWDNNVVIVLSCVDSETKEVKLQVIAMTTVISYYGIDDLKEILELVNTNQLVNLANCRPLKVTNYLKVSYYE